MTKPNNQPRILVLLDENTSSGGDNYLLAKDYITALTQHGAMPYCAPYAKHLIDDAVPLFDGFVNVGGNIAFPPEWLAAGQSNLYPPADRLALDIGLTQAFLAANKPVLGICHGMQVLAGIHGCTIQSDVGGTHQTTTHHAHQITIAAGSRLAQIIGTEALVVNSRHRQAIATLGATVVASAHAPDGVIEAIELPQYKFALGIEWHQENFCHEEHRGNKIFSAFCAAAVN